MQTRGPKRGADFQWPDRFYDVFFFGGGSPIPELPPVFWDELWKTISVLLDVWSLEFRQNQMFDGSGIHWFSWWGNQSCSAHAHVLVCFGMLKGIDRRQSIEDENVQWSSVWKKMWWISIYMRWVCASMSFRTCWLPTYCFLVWASLMPAAVSLFHLVPCWDMASERYSGIVYGSRVNVCIPRYPSRWSAKLQQLFRNR